MSQDLVSGDGANPLASAPPILPPFPPSEVRPVRTEPGIGPALALTAIYVVALVGFQAVLTVVLLLRQQPPMLGPWTSVLTMVLSFLLTVALMPIIIRRSWRGVIPIGVPPVGALPAVLLLSLGGWLWALEIGALTEMVMPMPESIAKMFEELFSTADPVGTLVLLVAVPPVVEETLCRGLVLRAMLWRWKPAMAILVSALVFGLIHLNPWQFFYATWLGLILGWVYFRTRSLGLCMVVHAVNNGLSWLVLRWQPDWMGLERKSHADPPVHLPPLLLLAGFGFVVAGAALLLRQPVAPNPAATSDPGSSSVAPA